MLPAIILLFFTIILLLFFYYFEFYFISLFGLLKITAFGVFGYIRDGYNLFDGCIVLISMANVSFVAYPQAHTVYACAAETADDHAEDHGQCGHFFFAAHSFYFYIQVRYGSKNPQEPSNPI